MKSEKGVDETKRFKADGGVNKHLARLWPCIRTSIVNNYNSQLLFEYKSDCVFPPKSHLHSQIRSVRYSVFCFYTLIFFVLFNRLSS